MIRFIYKRILILDANRKEIAHEAVLPFWSFVKVDHLFEKEQKKSLRARHY